MVKKKVIFDNISLLPQENNNIFEGFAIFRELMTSLEIFVFLVKNFFEAHALLFCIGFSIWFVLLSFLFNSIYFAAFVPIFVLSILLLIERMTFLAVKKDFEENGIF